VSPEELKKAVRSVGNSAEAVRRHLGKVAGGKGSSEVGSMESNKIEAGEANQVSHEISTSASLPDKDPDRFRSTGLKAANEIERQEADVSDRLHSAAQSFADIYGNAKRAGHDVYGRMLSSAGHLQKSLSKKACQAREQQPLQFLGVIAFAGLALGITARVWSSRRHG
jgi:hypothetical protein